MEKINVGIIGCGRISDLHYPGYRNNKNARIFAVCDTSKDIVIKKKNQWKATKYYTDYKYMLLDPEVDAVEILTPHHLHEEMVINAARAGKHIAVQKPMTISLQSADRMLKSVKDAGIVYKVTDNYLFYPPIVMAKKMIENGDIGTPTNLRMKLIAGGSGGWKIQPSSWEWRMKENSEGRGFQTFDHGHHLWATAWYLLGDVERVVSWIDSADGIVDSPAAIMWKYRDGTKYGMCEYLYAPELYIPSKYYANDEWIEISGTRGIILINRCTGNINDGPSISLLTGKRWRHYSNVRSDWSEGFRGATHNFINAIRDEEEPLLTGSQGREILRFNLAIQKSSRLRREVYIDEMDATFPLLYSFRKLINKKTGFPTTSRLISLIDIKPNASRYAPQARSLTIKLIDKFNPDAVRDWESTIGLNVLPEKNVPELKFSLTIKRGKATLEEGGLPDKAVLTLRIPAGTWAAILLGKEKIEKAFMEGRITIEGDAEEALKLRSAFGI